MRTLSPTLNTWSRNSEFRRRSPLLLNFMFDHLVTIPVQAGPRTQLNEHVLSQQLNYQNKLYMCATCAHAFVHLGRDCILARKHHPHTAITLAFDTIPSGNAVPDMKMRRNACVLPLGSAIVHIGVPKVFTTGVFPRSGHFRTYTSSMLFSIMPI